VTQRIVVVEPISAGNSLVEQAHALGWEVLVASYDQDDRTLCEGTRRLANSIIQVDTNDEQALQIALKEAGRSVPLDGVVPGCEFYVPVVARICAQLGLPGLDPATVDLVRHKAKMRAAVAAAGLDGPPFTSVYTPEEVDQAFTKIEFPAVVKAVESSGSIHVTRVDTLEEARAAVQAVHDDDDLDLGRRLNRETVIEQYVSGDEFSADGFVFDGKVTIAAITRKLLGPEPFFVELGHLTPAALSEETTSAVERYVDGVVRAVNVTSGPFHCELRVSDGKPVLMEIAARLPGDRIVDLIESAVGISLPRAALAAALGVDPAQLGAWYEAECAVAGIRFITAPGLARYDDLEGWGELSLEPWVKEKTVLIGGGEAIGGQTDLRCRIASVRFSADSLEHAMARWAEIGERVVVRAAV
jgi:biotin carboxylase